MLELRSAEPPFSQAPVAEAAARPAAIGRGARGVAAGGARGPSQHQKSSTRSSRAWSSLGPLGPCEVEPNGD